MPYFYRRRFFELFSLPFLRGGWLILLLILLGIAHGGALSGQDSSSLLERANELSDAGEFDEARALYERILEIGGTEGIVYFNLANLNFRQNNLAEAAMYYRKVIEIAPQFKNAYLNLGKLYYLIADYTRARAAFLGYVNVAPEDYDTLVLLGSTSQVLRDYTDALRYYERARELQDNKTEIYVLISQLYRELGDLTRAIEILTDAEFVVEDSLQLYRIKGEMLMSSGEYEAAASAFIAALTADELAAAAVTDSESSRPSSLAFSDEDRYLISIQIAEAYERAGLRNVAIFELKRIVEAFPNKQDSISYLEYLYLSENREQEAFDFFEIIYAANPNIISTFRNILARAYNSENAALMREILQFYARNDLQDEYSVLVGNYLLDSGGGS